MQETFTDLILEEKHQGRTIFMSSHMFDELEETCDRVAFLKNGHIIDVVEMSKIRGNEQIKKYKIEFVNAEDYLQFTSLPFEFERKQEAIHQVTILIPDEKLDALFAALKKLNVKFISQIPQTLERYFKEKYNTEEDSYNA